MKDDKELQEQSLYLEKAYGMAYTYKIMKDRRMLPENTTEKRMLRDYAAERVRYLKKMNSDRSLGDDWPLMLLIFIAQCLVCLIGYSRIAVFMLPVIAVYAALRIHTRKSWLYANPKDKRNFYTLLGLILIAIMIIISEITTDEATRTALTGLFTCPTMKDAAILSAKLLVPAAAYIAGAFIIEGKRFRRKRLGAEIPEYSCWGIFLVLMGALCTAVMMLFENRCIEVL